MKKVLIVLSLLVIGTAGLFGADGKVWAESGSGGSSASGATSKTCPAGSLRKTYTNSIAECSLPDESPTTGKKELPEIIKTIVTVVLSLVGIVAVVMIIMGGIGFVTSQGDAAKVTKARNTLLYGIVGLVIALLAFAIVNFVLSSAFKKE